jgi:hypothetical protein
LSRRANSLSTLSLAAILLAAFGWLGLILIMQGTLPTVGPRWLFFFCLMAAATGTALPFVRLLRRRFSSDKSPSAAIIMRQSLWVAFFVTLCAWLAMNRSFSLPLAFLLGVGLVIIEWLVRLLERSAWRPG